MFIYFYFLNIYFLFILYFCGYLFYYFVIKFIAYVLIKSITSLLSVYAKGFSIFIAEEVYHRLKQNIYEQKSVQ